MNINIKTRRACVGIPPTAWAGSAKKRLNAQFYLGIWTFTQLLRLNWGKLLLLMKVECQFFKFPLYLTMKNGLILCNSKDN